MDTFSLSIIYGIINNDKKEALRLSFVVSIFHFIMPLFGTFLGENILNFLPISSDFFIGLIFVLLSVQMFFHKEEEISLKNLFSFLLFGLTVSIDSFSVGIGLSQITNNILLSLITFSVTSGLFTYIGVRFGNIIGSKIGQKSTMIGAIILLFIGLYYIL